MLLSAPLDVARTKATTRASSVDERLGQVRAHEPVGARDEHGPAAVDVAELAPEVGDRLVAPDRVSHGREG